MALSAIYTSAQLKVCIGHASVHLLHTVTRPPMIIHLQLAIHPHLKLARTTDCSNNTMLLDLSGIFCWGSVCWYDVECVPKRPYSILTSSYSQRDVRYENVLHLNSSCASEPLLHALRIWLNAQMHAAEEFAARAGLDGSHRLVR